MLEQAAPPLAALIVLLNIVQPLYELLTRQSIGGLDCTYAGREGEDPVPA